MSMHTQTDPRPMSNPDSVETKLSGLPGNARSAAERICEVLLGKQTSEVSLQDFAAIFIERDGVSVKEALKVRNVGPVYLGHILTALVREDLLNADSVRKGLTSYADDHQIPSERARWLDGFENALVSNSGPEEAGQ